MKLFPKPGFGRAKMSFSLMSSVSICFESRGPYDVMAEAGTPHLQNNK